MSLRSHKRTITYLAKLCIVLLLISTSLRPSNFVFSKNEIQKDNSEYLEEDNEISYSLDGYYEIPELKASYIQPDEMSVYSSPERFDGYNVFVLDRHVLQSHHESILMVVDMDGKVVADKYLNSHASELYASAKLINSTTVLFGSLDGAKLWNYYTDVVVDLGFRGHHDFEYNPINDTYFTFVRYAINLDGTIYYFDNLTEYKQGGEIVWQHDTRIYTSHTDWCPYHDQIGIYPDVTHANSVFFDADEDVIYVNIRNTNTFWKINHTNGDVIWGLGGDGDFTLYNKGGIQRSNLFYHAHSVEKIDENTFILFDNDFHNQSYQFNYKSRMLEITINEQSMTANVTWEYECPSTYTSLYWSDADHLPNKNRFGTYGSFEHSGYSDIGARLVEVNSQGDIVWEINFPKTGSYRYGIYRAERFRLSPIISSPSDEWYPSNDSVSITWQTWYNYRNKRSIDGNYTLLLNSIPFDSGSVIFEQFWRPTNLSFDFGMLSAGLYNFTLLVEDGDGHISYDTVVIEIGDMVLMREGPEEIELGESNSFVRWNGFTLSPLQLNLTVNDTLIRTEEWNDTFIEFDLNTLTVGKHNITLQLFNDTKLVFNDSFWGEVYENAPALILAHPVDFSILWNNTAMLTWIFFDNSPNDWELLVDSEVHQTGTWVLKTCELNWTLPIFNEGIYNISLVIYDDVGNIQISSVFVTIQSPTPPIIVYRSVTEIIWNYGKPSILWEIHGGVHWDFYNDGILLASDTVQGNSIQFFIEDWSSYLWFPGTSNLTLCVIDEYGKSSTLITWINIELKLGDPYADEYIETESVYVENGNNALGAPDGLYTEILTAYGAGYITLDVGEYENFLDGTGDDFIVIAGIGQYICWASEELNSEFQVLGSGSGNVSFDLSSVGLSSVRYIRIQYFSGIYVELDAIEAIYYDGPSEDTECPRVNSPLDFWIWDNQSCIRITWETSDATHYNYSIEINDKIFESKYWDGSNIEITFFWDIVELHTFTLTLFDLFGNSASDTVNVDIRESTTEKSNIACTTVIFAILALVIIRKKRKTRI